MRLPIGPVLFDIAIVLEHLNITGTRLFLKLTLQACDNVLIGIKAAAREAKVVIALSEQSRICSSRNTMPRAA